MSHVRMPLHPQNSADRVATTHSGQRCTKGAKRLEMGGVCSYSCRLASVGCWLSVVGDRLSVVGGQCRETTRLQPQPKTSNRQPSKSQTYNRHSCKTDNVC